MSRQPKLMSIPQMRDILESHADEIRRQFFIDSGLAMIRGSVDVLRLLIRHQPPFTFDDRRMGVVLRGTAVLNLNLVEKRLGAGMLVFIGPGSIVSPVSISPDFELYGFGIANDFALPFAAEQLPLTMNGQVRDFQIPVGRADMKTACHILDALWHVVHQPGYNQQIVGNLIAAQMHHYDVAYRQFLSEQQLTQSREQTIFDRFLLLVNEHAALEHQIGFYASRMCLTERYLGTVVRQASGVTAKAWIDRALIARIKVELRHSDKSIVQISEELSFANPSFFCKYFKRLTQMTPAEYRES